MSTQTEHLHLDLREAADIFNPLSTNANFESLDNIIYEIQTKGGVPTYTTTASANLLKLSQNPTPNVTVFKFVAAGDANTWSYQETVNDIVALDGSKKTVKGGEMYVAWVNAANAMVVIAWPDVVNAQTFDGKGPDDWASKAQLDAVNQTAANATTAAQAAATVANNALDVATAAGLKIDLLWQNDQKTISQTTVTIANWKQYKIIAVRFCAEGNEIINAGNFAFAVPTEELASIKLYAYAALAENTLAYQSLPTKFTANDATITIPTIRNSFAVPTRIYGIK